MGLFNTKPKQQLKNINGYIIDELTGMLIDVPKGLQVYIIPKEVKQLNPDLNLTANKPLANMSRASEIIFEDGSIDMLPDKYFTFGGVTVFSNLKKVTLPVGIKKVGNDCIDATKTEFNIPATMEHLGKGIYPETQRLILGNNIRSLGDAFASHDTYLQYVEVAGTIKQLPPLFVNQCKNLKTLILHEGIETAGKDAFRNLNGLEYVELPESFKMPFQTSMENRSGSNNRGKSKYDGSNGVFEQQQNQTLTIKKTINGNSYIFKVRRGDFSTISFKNETAEIRSIDGKVMSIPLEKLIQDTIYQVNIQESKIQQMQPSQQQTQTKAPIQPNSQSNQYRPAQNQTPVPQPNTPKPIERQEQQQKPQFTNGFNEEQILDEFQRIYKMKVIPLPEFQLLSSEEKIALKKALFQKCESLVKKNNSLSVVENSISYNLRSAFSAVKRSADATAPDFEQTQQQFPTSNAPQHQHPEIPRNESIDDIYRRRYGYEKMTSNERIDFDRRLDDYNKRKRTERTRMEELKKQMKESSGQKRALIEERIRLEELNALNFANIMIQQQRLVMENAEEMENEETRGMSM